MITKDFRSSLKEITNKIRKTKLFPSKLKHHRNLSTAIPEHSNNLSTKKLFAKKEEIVKKAQPRSTLFNVNSTSLQQISSYGTNNKSKINNDTKKKEKEKEKDKNDKRKVSFISNEIEKNKYKYIEKKQKIKKKKSKSISQKNLLPQNPIKEDIDEELFNEKDEIIVRNKEICNIAENYLIVPFDLNEEIQKPELNVVNPNSNVEGNYSYYINGVVDSLKEFIELDYDSIFAQKNKDNVKYCYYTTSMDIEDSPKKKLLLIDLDETLVHTELRDKDNYKAIELFARKSKCKSKTFSYYDENYIYYIEVFFRPYLQEFLNAVYKYFDLAIFTASMKGYADTIIDYIDPNNQFFQFRLYRDACIPIQQRIYIKDLRIIKDYDPMNVILMDNSLYSFMNQPSNGMLVNSFYTNHRDTQLISAKNFLINYIYPCDDVRKECEKWYHFTNLFYKGTSKEIMED